MFSTFQMQQFNYIFETNLKLEGSPGNKAKDKNAFILLSAEVGNGRIDVSNILVEKIRFNVHDGL